MTPIPKGMPCRRGCENRFPGCHCESKKQWDAEQRAIKDKINQKRFEDDAIYAIRKPNTVKRRER